MLRSADVMVRVLYPGRAGASRSGLDRPNIPAEARECSMRRPMIIPLDVLREIAKEPLLPTDLRQRLAQRRRIRRLMDGQPDDVRKIARALLKARWDKLSGKGSL